MPYIIPDKRHHLDPHVDSLLNALRELESDDPANTHSGNLNYVITRLLTGSYATRYSEINEAVGVLECVKQEFYRRVAAPYEDNKAYHNGDAYPQELI